MLNPDHLESRTTIGPLPEVGDDSKVVASVLFLGIEESSDTEGFTPGEIEEVETRVITHNFNGELGKLNSEFIPTQQAKPSSVNKL